MANHGNMWLFTLALAASTSTATSVAAEDFNALAARCASDVHPATLRAVVAHESAFDPLVIGVNGAARQTIHPSTLDAAVVTATRLMTEGRSIDVGLGQINSKNFRLLGLTVKAAFDPCQNIAAAARLLRESYARLLSTGRGPRSALDAAISEYNTGNAAAGIANGYVAAVHDRTRTDYAVPDISNPAEPGIPAGPVVLDATPAPRPAAWDVFGDATSSSRDGMTVPKSSVSTPDRPESMEATVQPSTSAVVLFATPEQQN